VRQVLEDGTVLLSAGDCEFRFRRLRPSVILIQINGRDKGELGTAPLDEMAEDLVRFAPVELFVDAGRVVSAVLPVQEVWTEWIRDHRSALKGVSMLVRSNYMHFTAEVVRHFTRTGELMRVYLDPKAFGEALGRAAPGFSPE
jgi:hypothetical protein